MMGHSWRCFYRIMRKKIRWGLDPGDKNQQQRRCTARALRENRATWCRFLELEMLGGRDALKC